MYIKNNRGGALVLVILVMAMLAILGSAFVVATTGEGLQAIGHEQQAQAHYNARSGAYIGLEWLKGEEGRKWLGDDEEDVVRLFGNLGENLDLGENGKVDINILIEKDKENGEIKIESKGKYKNREENITIDKIVLVEKEENNSNFSPMDFAIFAVGKGNEKEPAINMEGSSRIEGSAGTNSVANSSIGFGWSALIKEGDLYLGPGAEIRATIETKRKVNNSQSKYPYESLEDWGQIEEPWGNVPDGEIKNLDEEITYPEAAFPDYPEGLVSKSDINIKGNQEGLISEDGLYNNISISGSNTLKIDLKNTERTIRVKNLDISQGHIKLLNTGDRGKLILYVEEELTIGGSSTINGDGDAKNLMLYYAGAKKPMIGGNTRLVGNSFIESADIEIAGSNGISGHIISNGNKIEVTGAADLNTRLIYAPKAHLHISGSGKIKGSAIVKTVSMVGSAKITFDRPNISEIENIIDLNKGKGDGLDYIKAESGIWSKIKNN